MILSRSYHNLNFDIAISNTTGASRVCTLPQASGAASSPASSFDEVFPQTSGVQNAPESGAASSFPQTQPKALTLPQEGNWKVCYILLPEGAMPEVLKWAEKAADENSCDLVLISGMDWNADMSPWMADGVMKKEKVFYGGAPTFLKELVKDSIPTVEQWLGLKAPRRYLMGISLSGLFAVWSLVQTDIFKGVASVSGSLWFDGFADWLAKHPLAGSTVAKSPAAVTPNGPAAKSPAAVTSNGPAAGTPAGASVTAAPEGFPKVYLSLGKREKNTNDKRMATVEDCTNAVVDILKEKGVDVTYDLLPGTHFSPVVPRFESALAVILA